MGLGERMQDIEVELVTEEELREIEARKKAAARLRQAIREGEEEDRREREARANRSKG